MDNNMREALADLEHARWSKWMVYLFSKGTFDAEGNWTMPKEFVERWTRQMYTPYEKLTEREKDSDRKEADLTLDLMQKITVDILCPPKVG